MTLMSTLKQVPALQPNTCHLSRIPTLKSLGYKRRYRAKSGGKRRLRDSVTLEVAKPGKKWSPFEFVAMVKLLAVTLSSVDELNHTVYFLMYTSEDPWSLERTISSICRRAPKSTWINSPAVCSCGFQALSELTTEDLNLLRLVSELPDHTTELSANRSVGPQSTKQCMWYSKKRRSIHGRNIFFAINLLVY